MSGDLISDLKAVTDRVVDRRVPRRGRLGELADRSDEPVTAAVHRTDEALCLPIVGHSLAHLLDPAGHRAFSDEPPAPDAVHQLLLGPHPVAVVDQVREDFKNLPLDPHPDTGAPQLDPRQIKLEIVEYDNHSSTLAVAVSDRNGRDPHAAAVYEEASGL